LAHWNKFYGANHSMGRKVMFSIEFVYLIYNMLFSWFNLACFFLPFYFLGKTIVDASLDPFHGAGIYIFYVLLYLYAALVIVMFIASMGNRPQGSKWIYFFAFVFFAFIMIYTFFAAIFLTVRGISDAMSKIPQGTSKTSGAAMDILFGNETFRAIIVALVGTYGLYIVSSLFYFDPWHMITSFVQYMLIAPSYINVLNVYAFCNTHDVSWGTKGDNVVSTDLGVANVKKDGDKDKVDIQMPTDQKDINKAYEEELAVLQTPAPVESSKPDAKTAQEDYYKQFRTSIVIAWLLSNGLLVALIASTTLANLLQPNETVIKTGSAGSSNFYVSNRFFAFILYSVAVLAFIRFVGSFTYILFAVFGKGR